MTCSIAGAIIPLGSVNIPLNPDPWFSASAAYANAAPIFSQTFGTLTGLGSASASFGLPPGLPGGYQLNFAYVVFGQGAPFLQAASNPVPVSVF